VGQRERPPVRHLLRRPRVGLGALAHGQGLVQVHLADVAGQGGDGPAGGARARPGGGGRGGDGPAGTARHRRGGVGRHHGPQAGEVGREAFEQSGSLHGEQFSTCPRVASDPVQADVVLGQAAGGRLGGGQVVEAGAGGGGVGGAVSAGCGGGGGRA